MAENGKSWLSRLREDTPRLVESVRAAVFTDSRHLHPAGMLSAAGAVDLLLREARTVKQLLYEDSADFGLPPPSFESAEEASFLMRSFLLASEELGEEISAGFWSAPVSVKEDFKYRGRTREAVLSSLLSEMEELADALQNAPSSRKM